MDKKARHCASVYGDKDTHLKGMYQGFGPKSWVFVAKSAYLSEKNVKIEVFPGR